ncbi:hypothetical protein Plo01_11230 [Planobispora longispora]|uniref:DUF397 domain-containing protein n=2 Tax=Planobispora longispora TaxID=28887 RepID=A0A8J3RJA9_9ACTN|nr:hypothetical protein Plo01_11230 [Planobispora longispora]
MTAPENVHFLTEAWHKSSHCNGGGCVEVAIGDDLVLVRDSKISGSPVLRYSHDEWRAFIMDVKTNRYGRL